MKHEVICGRGVIIAVAAVLAGSCNGHTAPEDMFVPRTDAEQEAKERMQHWVQVAGLVLEEPSIPEDERAQNADRFARPSEIA